jgi:hypothetical protein
MANKRGKRVVKIEEFKGKNVLIIGGPASGKSYVAGLLAKAKNHTVIHTDDYADHGYKEALYVLLKDIKRTIGPTIIEGVQGYRLLRKGVEYGCYYPDVVIELEVSPERVLQTYEESRPGKNTGSLRAFEKSNRKILADYLAMPNDRKPLWIKLKNNY